MCRILHGSLKFLQQTFPWRALPQTDDYLNGHSPNRNSLCMHSMSFKYLFWNDIKWHCFRVWRVGSILTLFCFFVVYWNQIMWTLQSNHWEYFEIYSLKKRSALFLLWFFEQLWWYVYSFMIISQNNFSFSVM